jgi:hypothetical protein
MVPPVRWRCYNVFLFFLRKVGVKSTGAIIAVVMVGVVIWIGVTWNWSSDSIGQLLLWGILAAAIPMSFFLIVNFIVEKAKAGTKEKESVRDNTDGEKILEDIKRVYKNTATEIENCILSEFPEITHRDRPIKNKNVIEFECAVFLLLRLDYFITHLNADQKIRGWLNSMADNYLKTIGPWTMGALNRRLSMYSDCLTLGYVKDHNGFINNSYTVFFGLIKRAIRIDDWDSFIEIMTNDFIPPRGILDMGLDLIIEEHMILPITRTVKSSLQKLGFI